MLHFDVLVGEKKATVKGKRLQNALFLAFKNHFADLLGDKEITIKVTPVIVEQKVKEPKAKKAKEPKETKE